MESTQRPFSFSQIFVALAIPAFLLASIPGMRAQSVSAPAARPAAAPAGATPRAAAAQNQAPTPAAAGEENGAVPNDASHQGIRMHGHWVIDIKNPDGTLAQHREFENSLTTTGATFLLQLMAGYVASSDYAIVLWSTGSFNFQNYSSTPPCSYSGAFSVQGCVIVHSYYTDPGYSLCSFSYCGIGLSPTTYNFPSSGSPSMVLSGSITATQAGTIANVGTYFGACPGNAPNPPNSITSVSAATCNTSQGSNTVSSANFLSATSLPSAVSVAANQIIQVTVTISFS